jgi:hypothetical protein
MLQKPEDFKLGEIFGMVSWKDVRGRKAAPRGWLDP